MDNLTNFDLITQNSEYYIVAAKYISFQLKKYRGVKFRDTEE